MGNTISRSPKIDSQAFDDACEDVKVKYRGRFHLAAAYTDCTDKALQSRFNADNTTHRLGLWDALVVCHKFDDWSLFDALLANYANRGTHELSKDPDDSANVIRLLIKNNKQGGDLMYLYDKFLSNDGVLDSDETKQLLAEAQKGVADLQSVIAALNASAA